MRLIYLAVLLCTWTPAITLGQSVKEDLRNCKQQYEDSLKAWNQKHKNAKTEDESIARHKEWPGWNYAPKLVALAERAQSSQEGFEAICEVLDLGNSVGEFDREIFGPYERAVALLIEYHRSQDLRPICSRVRISEGSEKFLIALMENAESRETRADACYHLGRLYAEKRELLSPDSWAMRPPVGSFAKYNVDRCATYFTPFLEGKSSDQLYFDANRCFDIVAREDSDVDDLRDGRSLSELAKRAIYELKYLSVGGGAPEIDGEDLEGMPMQLTDSRGKVVLLVFWASWCGPCMGDIPHEKELHDRFAGRPFTIVGVNADETSEAARKAVTDSAIPWRSFYNGPRNTSGSIAESWNVSGWPTVYVIDHHGTIRFKHLRREELDMPLELVIREAEKAIRESK